jgi:hypothetical protein
MAQTDFARVLSKTEVQFKRASDALVQTRLFSEQSNLTAAYEAAFRFEAVLEQARKGDSSIVFVNTAH